jgi:hypothetical protein
MRIIRNQNELADLAKQCRVIWRDYVEAEGGPYGKTQVDVLVERMPDVSRTDIEAALELIERRDREREANRKQIERIRLSRETAEKGGAEHELRLAQARAEGYAEGRWEALIYIVLGGFFTCVIFIRHC